jgi:hypothetical protein
VVAARVGWCLQQGVKPSSILVITFTRKVGATVQGGGCIIIKSWTLLPRHMCVAKKIRITLNQVHTVPLLHSLCQCHAFVITNQT